MQEQALTFVWETEAPPPFDEKTLLDYGKSGRNLILMSVHGKFKRTLDLSTKCPRSDLNAKMEITASFFRKYLFLFTRLALGGVFIAASIDKIAHPADFAKIIYNYQVLPDSVINVSAIVLPWTEALLGVLIIAGVWLPGAVVLADLLLLAFFGALMYNLARGLDIHCGCFSTNISGEPQTAWYVLRDSFFLLLGLVLAVRVFGRKQRGDRIRL